MEDEHDGNLVWFIKPEIDKLFETEIVFEVLPGEKLSGNLIKR